MESLITHGGHSELLPQFYKKALPSSAGSVDWNIEPNVISDNEESITAEEIASIGRKFLLFREPPKKRIDGNTLSEISTGLNMVATGIKIVTTILTLFGADTVDR